MREVDAAMSDDKILAEMAAQNGIDPENFDYDEWLANQDLTPQDPTGKKKWVRQAVNWGGGVWVACARGRL